MTQEDMQLAQQAADAIREWPQRVADAGVKCHGPKRTITYHPVARNVAILKFVDDPVALIEEARKTFNVPPNTYAGEPDGPPLSAYPGFVREVQQAGYEYTWEGTLLNRDAPWKTLFTNAERQRVLNAARAV